MKVTPPKLVRVVAHAKTVRKVEQVLESENGFASVVSLTTAMLMRQKTFSRSGLSV